MRPPFAAPALALVLALHGSPLSAQEPHPACAADADRPVPAETVAERAAAADRVYGLLQQATESQVAHVSAACPDVVEFIRKPFDAGTRVPGAAQLEVAVQVLTPLLAADPFAPSAPPPPPPRLRRSRRRGPPPRCWARGR